MVRSNVLPDGRPSEGDTEMKTIMMMLCGAAMTLTAIEFTGVYRHEPWAVVVLLAYVSIVTALLAIASDD